MGHNKKLDIVCSSPVPLILYQGTRGPSEAIEEHALGMNVQAKIFGGISPADVLTVSVLATSMDQLIGRIISMSQILSQPGLMVFGRYKHPVRNLNLGEGEDCASGGGDCIDDPVRGDFRVDLEGTPFEFTTGTFVNMYGWSSIMRVTTEDGMLAEEHVGAAPAENAHVVIPSGTKTIEVICGGWCGGCISVLYVTLALAKIFFFLCSVH